MKEELIGRGSIGTVYKALETNGDLLAIKIIKLPESNFKTWVEYLDQCIKRI